MYACIDCAYKKNQYGKKEGFLHPIPKSKEPLCTWYIDHLGPFCKTNRNYAYVFMIVDSFSKYLFARPTKTTNSKEVIYCLKDLFSMFGVPKRIIADRGKAFKSKTFKEFCDEKKIKLILNAVSSPRSNGQVERYNRTLLNGINTSIDNENEWNDKLPDVVWGMNNTICESTGYTPLTLMFGFDKDRHGNLGQEDIRLQNRQQIAENAKQKMDLQSKNMKKRFDKKRKESTKYNVGDLVLWRGAKKDSKDVSRKTGVKYGGPYKVSKVFENDRYEIVALKGLKGYQRYSAVVAADTIREFKSGAITESDTSSDSEINSTDELIDLLES